MKKVFLWCICFIGVMFLNINMIDAEMCDAADFQKMKELSKMISANYHYVGDIYYSGNYQFYEISFDFNGLDDQVFISEYKSENKVSNGGEKLYVESGKKTFYVYYTNCMGRKLHSFQVDLPKFNMYSITEACNSYAKELDVCDKWYQGNLSTDRFNEIVAEYYDLKVEAEKSFIEKNFVFIVVGVGITIFILLVFIIIRVRRNRLD